MVSVFSLQSFWLYNRASSQDALGVGRGGAVGGQFANPASRDASCDTSDGCLVLPLNSVVGS